MPVVMTEFVSVLLLKPSTADCVTITPLVGKVARETMPVPPDVVGRMPVTAAV